MSKAKQHPSPDLPDTTNPEWTAKDFARAKPAVEVLPARLMRKVRGPQKAQTKERITIRLSRDVLERFRAAGPGWQGRIDRALRIASERNRV